MKSMFSSASRPSILLEEPREAGHLHGARLSPPSVDFKPLRGMDGQGMFRVHFAYLSLMDCLNFNFFWLKASSSHTSQHGPKCLPLHLPLDYMRKMWWENLLDTYSESRKEL